jgi:hypothetical protein
VPGDGCVKHAAVPPPLVAAGHGGGLVVEAEQESRQGSPRTHVRMGQENLARFARAAFG